MGKRRRNLFWIFNPFSSAHPSPLRTRKDRGDIFGAIRRVPLHWGMRTLRYAAFSRTPPGFPSPRGGTKFLYVNANANYVGYQSRGNLFPTHLFVISLARASIFVSRTQHNFSDGGQGALLMDKMTRRGCPREKLVLLLNWGIFDIPRAVKMSVSWRFIWMYPRPNGYSTFCCPKKQSIPFRHPPTPRRWVAHFCINPIRAGTRIE